MLYHYFISAEAHPTAAYSVQPQLTPHAKSHSSALNAEMIKLILLDDEILNP